MDAVTSEHELPLCAAAPGVDFAELYAQWFHEVCRWTRSLGISDGDIEDVAQEVFVGARRRLHAFHGGSLANWLYCITARAARDHRRRAWFRRWLRPDEDVDMDVFALSSPGPDEDVARKQDRVLLARLLARMSEKKRTVLILFDVEGYTGEEIAEIQGIPVDTVRTRLHHARRELRERLLRHQKSEGL